MSKKDFFPDSIDGKFIGKNQWKLDKKFRYKSKLLGLITVPPGFVSDGASIPSILWSVVGSPWSGDYPEAALVHDFLYFKQAHKRAHADRVFIEAMKVLGVNWFKRRLMYSAVRSFGWLPWNKQKKKNSKKN